MLALKGEHHSAVGVMFNFPKWQKVWPKPTKAQPISPAGCAAQDWTGRTKTSCNLKALLSRALYAENLHLSIMQPHGTSVGSSYFAKANLY